MPSICVLAPFGIETIGECGKVVTRSTHITIKLLKKLEVGKLKYKVAEKLSENLRTGLPLTLNSKGAVEEGLGGSVPLVSIMRELGGGAKPALIEYLLGWANS